MDNTVEQANQGYMVDWLKVRVEVDHNPEELNSAIRFDAIKTSNGYGEPMKSYKEMWITEPSYSNKLKVKSTKDGTLLIDGNLGKWLTGHNITGNSDVIALVYKTVMKLAEISEHITPTQQQLDAIQKGYFKIHVIDVNKAILFENKDKALKYLERLKLHASYARFDKVVKPNGIYFGYDSQRKTFKYYHKGIEVDINKKYQHKTDELQALANRMIRCELRLKWRELNDNNLLNGFNWTPEIVKQLIDDAHSRLRMPKQINFPEDLPSKYIRFITCFKAGSLEGYTTSTIDRMRRDLIRLYGIDLRDLSF
ncbi:phage/plasmid replication protein, II/X family [Psychrobacter sp. TAE2020]|uniref:phage/plasmid replication protein, II/X family n=1 Tax=Psychrobacter sp. TAE2020 TaxID=2846762 RepID=UPI001C1229E6|nr:phage/plasmid replication protein, II/X family [Psychrobacter sp. TAE2020]MBU5618081.1 phage/plasmid replication protein, II/X family [Psychrobacter sp. TAE2020]